MCRLHAAFTTSILPAHSHHWSQQRQQYQEQQLSLVAVCWTVDPTCKEYSIVQISPQIGVTPIDAILHETCKDMQTLQTNGKLMRLLQRIALTASHGHSRHVCFHAGSTHCTDLAC